MICLLDMDDVLIDFVGQAHKFHGLPFDIEDYPHELGKWDVLPPEGINERDFWAFPEDFWATLPWTKDGEAILNAAKVIFRQENVYLCTSPTKSPASASGKMRWVQENLPEFARKLIITPVKYLCANQNTVLVDDANHNINMFHTSGGRTILVPKKWNSMHERYKDSLRYTLEEMQVCLKSL